IYRLGSGVLKRISLRLFGLGAAITLPALGGIYLLLNQVYGFPVGAAFLFWGGLFVLPIYYYLPQIYLLYKLDLQSKVLYINLLGIMANLLLNVCLIPGFGLLGAIAASALSQWLMLLAYRYVERRWLAGRAADGSGPSSGVIS
ncbi:MAG: polysaccharide biosynthesis C-terminal domain-containing protein, partial [Calditrichaeota bacterium]|nr:polysaccharide biosynthesis C-terminal domain-containing protein [Calditrichota bacterium]